MNTGFLGPAVATVLTVYGIETEHTNNNKNHSQHILLQQYLPFTVLKHAIIFSYKPVLYIFSVATVLTVYGIETR